MKKTKSFVLLLLLAVSINYADAKYSKAETDSVIAIIGQDYKVTFNDLEKYVSDWQYNLKYRNNISEGFKVALNALLINQLKRLDFFERGLNKNVDLVKNIRRFINEELIAEYYEKQFVEKYANEEKAIEEYKLMDKEIIYYQVFMPIKGNEKKEVLDSIETKANEVQNDLRKDKNIDKIIKKYSRKDIKEDNIRSIKWEQSIKDPVAGVVFKLKKGYTRVIKSFDGLYIVKIKDVKNVYLEPFEKIKDNIISKLKEGYSEKYRNEFEKYKFGFIDKNTIVWNEKGLEKIAKWSKIQEFYSGAYADTINGILQKGGNFEILSYNNGLVDLKEFLRLLENIAIINNLEEEVNVDRIKDFILEAISSDYIVKKAQELDFEKTIFSPYTKNIILKHRIALLYNEAVIDGSIPAITEEALHSFYEEQKDSIFYQLMKINVNAIIYSDSAKAAEAMSMLRAGTPYEKLSNRLFVKSFIRQKDGVLSSYLSKEPPYLAEESFKLGLNDIAGPIEYYDPEKGKQFAIIKCIYSRPEKQLMYDEVSKSIEEDFKNYHRKKITSEVESELWKKYKVEIFDDFLTKILSDKKS
jgi:hypothetical protein